MKNLNIIFFLILYLFQKTKSAGSGGPEEKSNEPINENKEPVIPVEASPSDLCEGTQPTRDIPDDCIQGNSLSDGRVCCYMTIKFKEGTQYSCIPLNKNKNEIKAKIKEIKEKYKDIYKSAKINCYSKLNKLNFISLYLLLLFLL